MSGRRIIPLLLASMILLTACGRAERAEPAAPETAPPRETPAEQPGETPDREEQTELKLQIGETAVAVQWEENEAVDALRELTEAGPLTIELSMYGGFEQVGPLGRSLPHSDVRTTTAAGDIVLYAGDQIVVFYGSNTWAYTRLGHITDKTDAELKELLGKDNVTLMLSRG